MSDISLSNYEGNGVNETETMCEDLSPGRCLTVRHGEPGYYQPSAQIIFFLFVRCTSICHCVDDTTVFACQPTVETIIRQLETDGTLVAKWFSDNYLKLNDDKCHLMIFSVDCSKATVASGN